VATTGTWFTGTLLVSLLVSLLLLCFCCYSHWPLSHSGWHSLSENPANQAAPSILSWDVAHYSINKKAEEKSQSTTSKNRRVIGLLYFFWLLILVGFVAANKYNGCLSSGEKQTLVLPVLVIIWVSCFASLCCSWY
jgi:hypothetical protein